VVETFDLQLKWVNALWGFDTQLARCECKGPLINQTLLGELCDYDADDSRCSGKCHRATKVTISSNPADPDYQVRNSSAAFWTFFVSYLSLQIGARGRGIVCAPF